MVYKKLFRGWAPPSQSARPASTTDLDSCGRRTETGVTACQTPHNTGLNRFPFNNFTHCLTAFSRCFSSFPHGTCSLSVSCQYLALDEIYHPLWAAFPSNSTLRRVLTTHAHIDLRGSHPLWRPIQGNLIYARTLDRPLQLTIRIAKRWDSKFELFPLHSPLLGESLLVSFPPLTDMLKFSG